MNNMCDELYYMNIALKFADKFDYITHPNPCVGCILVKDGNIISYGASEQQGGRHAEVAAIDNAKLAGIDISGCTAYVTLEPCCHFGKTPPCTSYLLKHNIRNVIVGLPDPNPLVSGKGVEILKQNGVNVKILDDISMKEKISFSMRGFLNYHTKHKPWIRVKLASSIDGVMSLNNGVSKWITSSEARLHNQKLRARAGAILTSIETIIADNPLMNVRNLPYSTENNLQIIRQPLRIVLDTQGRGVNLANYNIFKNQNEFPLLWICGENCADDNFNKLAYITNVIKLPNDIYSHICLKSVIDYIYKLNINEIHVEAGATLTSAFIKQDLFDEIALYQAPVFLGNGNRLMKCLELESLEYLNKLKIVNNNIIGEDLFINMIKK